MRRMMQTVAVVAAVTLLAGACTGSGSSGVSSAAPSAGASTSAPPVRGDEDLVIWTDAATLDAVRTVADAFAKANRITVGVQAVADTRADFITANNAGDGPDVLVGTHDWIGQLVADGAIDPLRLPASALSGYVTNAVKAVTYQDQVYGLPYGVESLALFCNKKYAPDTYATLDDVIAAGQRAKDAGAVQSALAVPQGTSGDAYSMQPLYTAAGGYLFGTDADGSYNASDLGVGTAAGIAAAKKIASLGDAGSQVLSTSITDDNAISLFASGKAACLISGPSALTDVTKGLGSDGFTVQAIPGFAGESAAQPFMEAQAFYVASKGANKTFAQAFLTGTTAGSLNTADAMTTLDKEADLPPAMTSVRESLASADPILKVFSKAADAAAPTPAFPAMDQVRTTLGQAYAAIIGGADPTSTMTEAAAAIPAALAKS